MVHHNKIAIMGDVTSKLVEDVGADKHFGNNAV